MRYECFVERVSKMVGKSGLSVEFSNESGNYTALVSNGMRFFACESNSKVRIEGFRENGKPKN